MKHFKIYTLLIFICFSISISAQTPADSIYALIHKSSGVKKIDLMIDFANRLRKINPDSAESVVKKIMKISLDNKMIYQQAKAIGLVGYINFNRNKFTDAFKHFDSAAKIFVQLNDYENAGQMCQEGGIMNLYLSSFPKAIEYFQKTIDYYSKSGNKKGVADALQNIGSVYLYLGNNDKALTFYKDALERTKALGYQKSIASLMNNIGHIFINLRKVQQALDYFTKSYELSQQTQDKQQMAYASKNIGLIYIELEKYDKALEHFSKSLFIEREMNDLIGVSTTLENIGSLYLKTKNYKKAETYLLKAYKIQSEIDDKYGTGDIQVSLAKVKMLSGRTSEALPLINNALKIANEIKSKKLEVSALNQKYIYYKNTGSYKEAFEACEAFIAAKDSLYIGESNEKIAELQVRFETEQKDRENELLRKSNEIKELEISKQETIRNNIVFVLALVLVSSLLFLFRYRSNNKTNKILSEKNELITKQKEELTETIEELKRTHKRMLETEKMASLGGLIAGVAHEINTPVGICITAVSTLIDKTKEFKDKVKTGEYSQAEIENFLEKISVASDIAFNNLVRSGDLVQSFKQVSVDQITEQQRPFNFSKYLDDVILSLKPKLKDKDIKINIDCEPNLEVMSFPGVYAQIFTNLILNSHIHAFKSDSNGIIDISIIKFANELKIIYSDNGAGIPEEILGKIYDPFFTTNKQTGTGLGLNIVYNLVTQKLGGEIKCESFLGKGTIFVIRILL